jgi:hypothetical protein
MSVTLQLSKQGGKMLPPSEFSVHLSFKIKVLHPYIAVQGPGSSVGIATNYGLDGPGIESQWGREFLHLSRPALGPTQSLYNGYRVFPGGKAAGAWC